MSMQMMEEGTPETTPALVRMALDCPECQVQHLDEGIWETRPHKTHQCQACGHEWRPHEFFTVGVAKAK